MKEKFLTLPNGINDFHCDHLPLMKIASGSKHNHQSWTGGYLDHIAQCFVLARRLYSNLNDLEPVPFTLESALLVLYFHDIEKIWKNIPDKDPYSFSGNPYPTIPDWIPAGFEKWEWFGTLLDLHYGITFNSEELNALQYIHGEGEDYTGSERKMGPLGAFCHSVDVISARIFFESKGETWTF